jgi:hypothetical protein
MPQLQPGQVVPGQDGAPKVYGLDKTENAVPFQEKLMRLFKPQEFVTIKNIDDEALYWQYMPADGETESMSEDGMQKQISRTAPEMWVINPGEVEVLVGASAYRALDVLYKNCTAKSTLKRFSDPTKPQFNEKNEHLPKNFNFADGGAQDNFIERAYLGKAMPTFQQAPAIPNTPQQPLGMQPEPVAAAPAPEPTPQYAAPDAETVNKAKELTSAGNAKK